MEMGTRGPSRGASQAYDLVPKDTLALPGAKGRKMGIEGEKACPMIEDHGLATQVAVSHEHHPSVIGGANRGADCGAEVYSGMGAPWLIVQHSAKTERAPYRAWHRPLEGFAPQNG